MRICRGHATTLLQAHPLVQQMAGLSSMALWLQVETLAQQVADLQDQADAREDAHNERVQALQATIERLSGEADSAAEARIGELEAKCTALEEQVCTHADNAPAPVPQTWPRVSQAGYARHHCCCIPVLSLLLLQVADMDSANIELEDANTQLEASTNAAEQRCAAMEQEVQKLQSAQSTLKVGGYTMPVSDTAAQIASLV